MLDSLRLAPTETCLIFVTVKPTSNYCASCVGISAFVCLAFIFKWWWRTDLDPLKVPIQQGKNTPFQVYTKSIKNTPT